MPTRTDVQTDVHIVPVDSDSPTRKLAITLIYQCKWCSYLAQTYSLAAPSPSLKTMLNQCNTSILFVLVKRGCTI